MKSLVIGSGPVCKTCYNSYYDIVIFVNTSIEYFHKIKAKNYIWITKSSRIMSALANSRFSSWNANIRNAKIDIISNFLRYPDFHGNIKLILLTEPSWASNDNTIDFSQYISNFSEVCFFPYSRLYSLTLDTIGFASYVGVIINSSLNLFLKSRSLKFILNILLHHKLPNFSRPCLGTFSIMYLNSLLPSQASSIIVAGITNYRDLSDKEAQKQAFAYQLNGVLSEVPSIPLDNHLSINKVILNSLPIYHKCSWP